MKPAPRHLTHEEEVAMTRDMAWAYVRELRDKVRELEARLKALEDAMDNGRKA